MNPADSAQQLTPEAIVALLDKHIVGQERAKRSVAVALRNRWRRRQLPAELAAEVYPKNILLIGPTGVGKTEIARRLAELAGAPFIKVEASKYSEVGYHGRDVESIIRDLMEIAIRLVRREKMDEVKTLSEEAARDRILTVLYEEEDLLAQDDPSELMAGQHEVQFTNEGGLWKPVIEATPVSVDEPVPATGDAASESQSSQREQRRSALATQLDNGELEERVIEIELKDNSIPTLSVKGPAGTETMGIDAQALQEVWGRTPTKRTKLRKLSIKETRKIVIEEEGELLIDADQIMQEAVERAENDGIVFIDEIDKIVGAGGEGPDVSREGVQRDLLTVVEGCTVFTKHGDVRTHHILFLAAGAFHFHKPSELIPELQGRFPVRVALRDLSEEDFVRILTEPKNSLVQQYQELLKTEGVALRFTEDGLKRLAAVAYKANKTTQSIGARRLMTTLEMLLEEISFDAPNLRGHEIVVNESFVTKRLGDAADDPDLIKYLI